VCSLAPDVLADKRSFQVSSGHRLQCDCSDAGIAVCNFTVASKHALAHNLVVNNVFTQTYEQLVSVFEPSRIAGVQEEVQLREQGNKSEGVRP
jgi:hypothetical protein